MPDGGDGDRFRLHLASINLQPRRFGPPTPLFGLIVDGTLNATVIPLTVDGVVAAADEPMWLLKDAGAAAADAVVVALVCGDDGDTG